MTVANFDIPYIQILNEKGELSDSLPSFAENNSLCGGSGRLSPMTPRNRGKKQLGWGK
jgi:hypothetical protein